MKIIKLDSNAREQRDIAIYFARAAACRYALTDLAMAAKTSTEQGWETAKRCFPEVEKGVWEYDTQVESLNQIKEE